jgi:hypothetical protein
METKPTKPAVYGLIISLILIVFGLVTYFTNQTQNKALNSVAFFIFLFGIILSCIQYAKQMNGNVTFGNVFAHGFKTTAVIIVIEAVYTFISYKFIFPDMVEKGLEIARKSMEEKKNMTEEQINQGIEITRKFFVPITIGSIILLFGILGLVASAIGAALAKKKPQSPFQQQG